MKKTILLMCAWLWVAGAFAQKTADEWVEKAVEAEDFNPEQCIEYCSKAIRLVPNHAVAYRVRGSAKGGLKRYADALADFDKAIQFDPNDTEAYASRGFVKILLGRYANAIPDFDKEIELGISGRLGFIHNFRGKAQYEIGQYAEAISDYDKAIELGGKDFNPQFKYREAAVSKLAAQNSDQTPPVLTLTAPAWSRGMVEEHVVQDAALPISGTATDNRSTVSVTVAGEAVAVGKGGFFKMTVSLAEGSNTIIIQAQDAQKNQSEITLHVRLEREQPTPKSKQKRLALVIGNGRYANIRSLNEQPINDATDMETRLKNLGFTVIRILNVDKMSLKTEIRNFTQTLKNYDIGLMFYAGHGLGIGGKNYLVPTDFPAKASKSDVDEECVSLDWIQSKMADAGTTGKTNILIVDACRSDGGLRNLRETGSPETWSPPNRVPSGFITCYAASLGQEADNGTKRNGLYTSILLRHIATPNLKIEDLFKRVRIELLQQGGQEPEETTKLTQDFYFKQ